MQEEVIKSNPPSHAPALSGTIIPVAVSVVARDRHSDPSYQLGHVDRTRRQIGPRTGDSSLPFRSDSRTRHRPQSLPMFPLLPRTANLDASF